MLVGALTVLTMKSSLKEDAPQQEAATNTLHLDLIIFAHKPLKIKRRLELSVSVDGSMAQHTHPKVDQDGHGQYCHDRILINDTANCKNLTYQGGRFLKLEQLIGARGFCRLSVSKKNRVAPIGSRTSQFHLVRWVHAGFYHDHACHDHPGPLWGWFIGLLGKL